MVTHISTLNSRVIEKSHLVYNRHEQFFFLKRIIIKRKKKDIANKLFLRDNVIDRGGRRVTCMRLHLDN